jgi:indole-3-glycerol phosphate synthase
MAKKMVRNDVKSVKNTLEKNGPTFLVGIKERSPSEKVRHERQCKEAKAYDADGWADFSCSAESVSIWTKTDARGRDEFKKD